MADLTYWFEFASPYSYLTSTRIDALAAARGVTVAWKPFLLGPIFAAHGWDTSPFKIYPAKGRYMWRDVERRCAAAGVPFRTPTPELLEKFPMNTVAAARLAVVGLKADWGKAFVRAVYHAEYAEHRDIGDRAVLVEILRAVGTDPDTAFEAANAPANKPLLRANTMEAQERGIFGVPSFTCGEELFWGDDRLEDALNHAMR